MHDAIASAVIAVQSCLLHRWFVPSARAAVPRNASLQQIIERDMLWPLRQDVAGRLAWRLAGTLLLTMLALAVLSRARILYQWQRFADVCIDAHTLLIAVITWAAVLAILVLVELVLPTHVRRGSIYQFFDGSHRRGNPVGDWLYNALMSTRIGNLEEEIRTYIDKSREDSFDPASRDAFHRIETALSNSLTGKPDKPCWERAELERVVGRVSVRRAIWHSVLMLLALSGTVVTVAAFRM